MSRLYKKKKKIPALWQRLFTTAVLFSVCACFFLQGVSAISKTAADSQLESLQLAITRSAVHCYAIEGKYPESIDYIKEHYGINWDPRKFAVDYEILGANLMPSITVIPLTQKEDGK